MDDFESLMATIGEKPVNDSAPSRSSEEKSHRPLASPVLLAKKGMIRPLAKMMARVQCSRCEFTGKQGKEMRDHIKKKHEIDFKCKECDVFCHFVVVAPISDQCIFEIRLAWTFSSSPETWFKMLLMFLACRLSASATFLFTSVASSFASYSLFLVVMFAICPVMTVFFVVPSLFTLILVVRVS